jgi:methylated-DNA-[protein]-cysteine S-methyltransferase
MRLWMDEVPTPIGGVTLLVDPESRMLCGLDFDGCQRWTMDRLARRFGALSIERAADPCGLASTIRSYFDGDVEALSAVRVAATGTPFEEQVWRALRDVPAGATSTYGEIARAVGSPGAARAVGAANAHNPVALVVPCHRIVGTGGALTGYGGGLDRKRWLLAHEARHAHAGGQLALEARA